MEEAAGEPLRFVALDVHKHYVMARCYGRYHQPQSSSSLSQQ